MADATVSPGASELLAYSTRGEEVSLPLQPRRFCAIIIIIC